MTIRVRDFSGRTIYENVGTSAASVPVIEAWTPDSAPPPKTLLRWVDSGILTPAEATALGGLLDCWYCMECWELHGETVQDCSLHEKGKENE